MQAVREPAGPAARRSARRARAVLLASVFVLAAASALVAALLVHAAIRGGDEHVVTFSPNRSVLRQFDDAPAVLARVLPSVVAIRTELAAGSTPNCGERGVTGGVAVDEGTGIVIGAGDEILTNNHVVAGGTAISVTLTGRRGTYPATLVGADPADDLALLQLRGAPSLPPIPLGSSAGARVGEPLLAVGNALGLAPSAPSVTEGILSAEQRVVDAAVSCTHERLSGLFQTDAAINPGNSGGPLLDAGGRVVAVDTAVAGGGADGPATDVGFAIPIDRVLALLPGLRAGGTVGPPRAFLGLRVEAVTPLLQQEFGYVPSYGAVVDSVVPGSPASAAGLEPGDVVVSFGRARVSGGRALARALRAAAPGERIALVFYRGTRRRIVTVLLTTAPSPA